MHTNKGFLNKLRIKYHDRVQVIASFILLLAILSAASGLVALVVHEHRRNKRLEEFIVDELEHEGRSLLDE